MKTILTIGHSIMGAKNMAKDLIDIRGEREIKSNISTELLTKETLYVFLPWFHINEKGLEDYNGTIFNEVYIMGDTKVEDVGTYTTNLKDYVDPYTELKQFGSEPLLNRPMK
jgi:hypothetical protein